MEMKKCKECGKMFMPKGRESYCSDIHYRPCPVCGKPVEAKYLSDPARRCEDCKKSRSAVKPAIAISASEFVKPAANSAASHDSSSNRRTYIGPSTRSIKFVPGHVYEIMIDRVGAVYEITSYKDCTDNIGVDLFMQIGSMISFARYFSDPV